VASDLENLKAARTAILVAIASGAGKPNYTIDGQSVSWDSLFTRLDQINKALAAVEGPVEVVSYGY
jgi:hypothetical protein